MFKSNNPKYPSSFLYLKQCKFQLNLLSTVIHLQSGGVIICKQCLHGQIQADNTKVEKKELKCCSVLSFWILLQRTSCCIVKTLDETANSAFVPNNCCCLLCSIWVILRSGTFSHPESQFAGNIFLLLHTQRIKTYDSAQKKE